MYADKSQAIIPELILGLLSQTLRYQLGNLILTTFHSVVGYGDYSCQRYAEFTRVPGPLQALRHGAFAFTANVLILLQLQIL